MFLYLSKLIPLFLYPLGMGSVLIVLALFLRRRWRWAKWLFVAAFVALWLGGNRWVAGALVRSLEGQYISAEPIPTAEMIVVLGGGTESFVYPRRIPEINQAGDRLIYAAHLYKEEKAPNIVLSGGGFGFPMMSIEADDMAMIMDIMGVEQDALILERESRNTYENAVNTKALLDPLGIDRIILVTSAIHMPRSAAIFEKQGFEVLPAPTDYQVGGDPWATFWEQDIPSIVINAIPQATYLDETTNALKEYLGMVIYTLRGWM